MDRQSSCNDLLQVRQGFLVAAFWWRCRGCALQAFAGKALPLGSHSSGRLLAVLHATQSAHQGAKGRVMLQVENGFHCAHTEEVEAPQHKPRISRQCLCVIERVHCSLYAPAQRGLTNIWREVINAHLLKVSKVAGAPSKEVLKLITGNKDVERHGIERDGTVRNTLAPGGGDSAV